MSDSAEVFGVDAFPLDPDALDFLLTANASCAGQYHKQLCGHRIGNSKERGRDVYFLCLDEMALLKRRYPTWDWGNPQWQLVARDLVQAGHNVDTLNKCNVTVLLDWLKKLDATQGGQGEGNTQDTDSGKRSKSPLQPTRPPRLGPHPRCPRLARGRRPTPATLAPPPRVRRTLGTSTPPSAHV